MLPILLFIVAFFMGIVLAALVLLVKKNQKQKRMRPFINRLNQLGADLGICFSAQVWLKEGALGVDGVRRKLVVLHGGDREEPSHDFVDIDGITTCRVIKQPCNGSRERKGRPASRVLLRMERKEGPVDIVFYDPVQNDGSGEAQMERKARYWAAMIRKMKCPPDKGRR